MQTICYKRHARERAVTLSAIGASAAVTGLVLGNIMPRSGAVLSGFAVANLAAGGLYWLSQA